MVTAKEARAVARRMIRENKRLLLGSYLSYFGLTLAVVLLQFLFWKNSLLTTLWSFASLFLLVPLTLGILHIHNMIYYRRRCSVGNLFDFYRNYPVALKALGVSYIFSMILSAVLVPVLMITVLPLAFGGSLLSGFSVATAIISILAAVFVSVAIALLAESFVMANYFIALRNRSIRFGQLLGSALKTGGRCVFRYLLLQLSFFGWGALCCLPLVLTLTLGFYLTAAAGMYALNLLSLLPIGGMLLFGLAIFALTVYINAASTVFFNVAIDEYEQQYPDFSHIPAPPVPPVRCANPQESKPADRYAGPFRGGADTPPIPGGPPASEKETEKTEAGEAPAAEEKPVSREDPAPEKVEAEIIEPQDGLCDVILVSPGVGRMLVSMIICELTGMEHDAARQLVENAPKAICMNVPREEAREIAKRLTEAGARVELR